MSDKKLVIFLASFILANAGVSFGTFFLMEQYRRKHQRIVIKSEEPTEVKIDSDLPFFKYTPEKMGRFSKTIMAKKLMEELKKRDVEVTINFKKGETYGRNS